CMKYNQIIPKCNGIWLVGPSLLVLFSDSRGRSLEAGFQKWNSDRFRRLPLLGQRFDGFIELA
ncbi:MAG TPA: hypothetical protein PKO15_18690, partial [Fibrobacteria bacterium]|nr:hypothetical protein [Fibrobacteria bacterium]